MHDMKREARARWDYEVCGVVQPGRVFSRVWLPPWLYWSIPRICLLAGLAGLCVGLRTVPVLLLCYGLAVIMRRRWCALDAMLLCFLIAVPTITPLRRIVATTRTVQVDVVVVTGQVGCGPIQTTITPARSGKTKTH